MGKKKSKKTRRPPQRPGGERREETRSSKSAKGAGAKGVHNKAAGAKPGPRSAERTGDGQAPQTYARRERKEAARKMREAALKRSRRRNSLRRAGAVGVLTFVIAVGFLYLRGNQAGAVSEAAVRAATAAGCSTNRPESPAADAPGGEHVPSGQPITYQQHPATSGQHYADRNIDGIEPVQTQPVDEPAAVHSLEHAFVILYYRATGDGALSADVVSNLKELARNGDRVIIAPYESLPDGTALAMTAWNKLWECPATVTPEQARTMAKSFIEAYAGTNNAPEPPQGL